METTHKDQRNDRPGQIITSMIRINFASQLLVCQYSQNPNDEGQETYVRPFQR